MNLITDDAWLNTIIDRNVTSHAYDEDEVSDIVENIMVQYFPLFKDFENKMIELMDEEIKGYPVESDY